jgi:hypothetical protein
MVMSPTGLGNKNDCAGEGQQQFTSQSAAIHYQFTVKKWISAEQGLGNQNNAVMLDLTK